MNLNQLNKLSLFLILILIIGKAKAQERVLTGQVTDLMGNPLAGVNISVQDYPSIMTITGADGEYRIEVFDFSKALIFSFSGMKTKEAPIGDIDRILVKMEYLPMQNPNPISVGFYFRPISSKFYNSAVNDSPEWNLESRMNAMIELNFSYFITTNIGLGTGVAIGSYKSNQHLGTFNNFGENYIERIDKDGDKYFLYNIADIVNETTDIKVVSIPLVLKYQIRQHKKIGFYADFGLRFMYIFDTYISADIKSETQAYYPDYHIVLYDLPEYGFENINTTLDQEISKYESVNFSLMANLGLSYKMGKKMHADFGFYFEYGLTDIGFTEPQYQSDFLSTIGIQDKTSIRAIGFSIGIRYELGK
ncbi:MAG: outer membrane beta-barrel protein [Bacteroidales bacterium]|nr:outer membrane beta-barrel protein [Bacteroidales bacterium]